MLAHFIHIPWVGPTTGRCCPTRSSSAIHAGLLADDVVGFHTERWREAFLSACGAAGPRRGPTRSSRRIRSRSIRTSSRRSPERGGARAGARAARLAARDDDPPRRPHRPVEERRARPRRRSRCCSSAVPTCAAGSACSRCSTPRGRRSPSTSTSAGGSRRRRRRSRSASPARSRLRIADDFPQSIAAYKQFDVLLVNAVMDGLNLVAKEAPLVNTRDGVVVLSENAGAHEELGDWTVPVDPFDVEGQAEALEAALALPAEERRARLEAIREHVRSTTLAAGSTRSCPTSTAPVRCAGDERPLARRRVRRRAHGRRRLEADVAPPGRRARDRADGAGDRAAPARAAEGRRAHDRAARRDHGGEADERPDPALPPAAALGRRRLARGRRRTASRSRRRPRRPRRPASRWRRSSRHRSPR